MSGPRSGPGKRWTEEQLAFLRANSATMSVDELMRGLGKSRDVIHWKCKQLGLPRAIRRKWTEEDLATIDLNVQTMPLEELAALLGCTKRQLVCKVQHMNLLRWRLKPARKTPVRGRGTVVGSQSSGVGNTGRPKKLAILEPVARHTRADPASSQVATCPNCGAAVINTEERWVAHFSRLGCNQKARQA